MRHINVTLDLYSMVVCLILIGSLYLNGRLRDPRARCFVLMCASNLLMLLGDLTNWVCEGDAFPWNPFLLRAGSFLFYVSAMPLLLLFTRYVTLYLPEEVPVPAALWRMTAGLAAIYLFCCVLSLWNGMFFQIVEGNLYRRGSCFILSQLIPFLIYTVNGVLIFTHYRQLKRRTAVFMGSYIFLPLTAELLQALNYGVALLGTAITLSLLLIYINIQSERELRGRQQESELTESRIALMLSQIQPHFLYNTLSTIRQLCDVDAKQAKQAITEFSRFLRVNLATLANGNPVPFAQELEYLKCYVGLELKRFPGRLQVSCQISAVDFSIPPLTLQPIVENAVRHGVMVRESGGSISIRSEEIDDAFVITVSDDGVGFRPEEPCGGERPHIGISNVRSRLKLLCNGTLSITSRPGAGTVVVISLPKPQKFG